MPCGSCQNCMGPLALACWLWQDKCLSARGRDFGESSKNSSIGHIITWVRESNPRPEHASQVSLLSQPGMSACAVLILLLAVCEPALPGSSLFICQVWIAVPTLLSFEAIVSSEMLRDQAFLPTIRVWVRHPSCSPPSEYAHPQIEWFRVGEDEEPCWPPVCWHRYGFRHGL